MQKNNITVIIPMRNEIRHIERSVTSALDLTPHVYVVDSGSTDGSIEVAKSLGAEVFQYEWTSSSNFSTLLLEIALPHITELILKLQFL